MLTTFNAEAAGITSDDLIEQLLEYLPGTEDEAGAGKRRRKHNDKKPAVAEVVE